MGAFATGQVVVLPFPFSDLTRSKYRPALILADAGRGDWIACQITSTPFADGRAIAVTEADFATGPGKLFTAHELLFANCAGTLTAEKLAVIRQAVISLIGGEDA